MKYTIIILFFSSLMFGQELGEQLPVLDERILDIADVSTMKTYGIEAFDNRDMGIEGSVFIEDDWNTGIIKIANAKVYDQYKFKYNALDQNIIINMEGRFFALPGMFVESFEIESKVDSKETSRRRFIRKVSSDKNVYFLEVLLDGKYTLYKKHDIYVRKATYNAAMDVGEVKDKLEHTKAFFISFDDSMVEIPKKKRKFLKTFDEEKEIKDLFNSNSFDPTNESSLIDFIDKLNATKN